MIVCFCLPVPVTQKSVTGLFNFSWGGSPRQGPLGPPARQSGSPMGPVCAGSSAVGSASGAISCPRGPACSGSSAVGSASRAISSLRGACGQRIRCGWQRQQGDQQPAGRVCAADPVRLAARAGRSAACGARVGSGSGVVGSASRAISCARGPVGAASGEACGLRPGGDVPWMGVLNPSGRACSASTPARKGAQPATSAEAERGFGLGRCVQAPRGGSGLRGVPCSHRPTAHRLRSRVHRFRTQGRRSRRRPINVHSRPL